MSIAQNPLFSSLRKSFANVTAYTLNGQNIIRAKAFNPKNPNTAAQKVNRGSFKLIANTFQTFGQYTELGFVERKGNLSVYNAFMAANLPNAIYNLGVEQVVDYSKLLISKGSLPPISVTNCVLENNVITVSYPTKIGLPKVSTSDEILVLVLFENGAIHLTRKVRGTAAEGSINFTNRHINKVDLKCCSMVR